MNDVRESPDGSTAWVDHIPVLWFEPSSERDGRRLVILLTHLGGTKEEMIPYLQDIAAAGFVALTFDLWSHGERGRRTPEEIGEQVFANFRRNAWPIIGQTALDTHRVIDWAVATLGVQNIVGMGGLSMGGDISVTAAGIDRRIERVAAVVATPDWLRPGMEDLFKPGSLLPPGEPDAYAQHFYDWLNPLTHPQAYAHGPRITFVCGENDRHVPADGARRFRSLLREHVRSAGDRVEIIMLPGMGHVGEPERWWPPALDHLAGKR